MQWLEERKINRVQQYIIYRYCCVNCVYILYILFDMVKIVHDDDDYHCAVMAYINISNYFTYDIEYHI